MEGKKSIQAVPGTDPVNITNSGSEEDDFVIVKHAHVSGYERVILIIGKTGNGKSSIGNTLLGSKEFDVGRGMAFKTVETKSCVVPDKNCKLKVVDTPDLANKDMTEDEKHEEVCKWKEKTKPELHVILLAVRCDVRYTVEEYATYCEVKRLWENDTDFCKRLVVGFTFGDCLDGDINEELKSVCGELQAVLGDASNRYMVFNNKAQNKDTQQNREQLFNKVGDSELSSVLQKPGMLGYILSCFPEWNVFDSVLYVFHVLGSCVSIPYSFIISYAWPSSNTPELTGAGESSGKEVEASVGRQVPAEASQGTKEALTPDTVAASNKQCSQPADNRVPAETEG